MERPRSFLGTIPPFVLKTDDNPEGVDGKVFADIEAAIVTDRYAFFEGFLNNFYNVDELGGTRVSDRAWQASFQRGVPVLRRTRRMPASTRGSPTSVPTSPKIGDVPVLVLHGTEDRILPFEVTAARLPGFDR